MYVTKIKYENFRNLVDGEFNPGKEINVIYGDNAQGKTNLSEAVYLFCGQKSFRGNKDIQLINTENEQKPAHLCAEFYSLGRNQTAEINIVKNRRATLNNIPQSSAVDLANTFTAIIFSPADMTLISDGPAVRRKFLDNAISVLKPKYSKVITAYSRAVQQRNAILKDVQYHSELTAILDSFEDRIARNGAYIILQRRNYLEAVKKHLPGLYSGISDNRETIRINYKSIIDDDTPDEIKTVEKLLRAELFESRKEDMQNYITGVGPHRDDIEFFINDLSVKTYGSQGQKRSAVLALKLSEAELLKKTNGEQPITILDDVMSELDRSRQDYILNHIKGWQVFITCCDPNAIENLNEGHCFKMQNGVLVKG